jgi:hypothetical protein
MAATHITTEATINTKSGLRVDLPDFAMTRDGRSKNFIPDYAIPVLLRLMCLVGTRMVLSGSGLEIWLCFVRRPTIR